MRKLLTPYVAGIIRAAVFAHGKPWQREVWMQYLEHAPRATQDQRYDDTERPPQVVAEVVACCLHAEAARLMEIAGNPDTREDDQADAVNDLGFILTLLNSSPI